MTTIALKKKITGKINKADDLLLELVDALIEKYETSSNKKSSLTIYQQKELDRRMELHDSGKLKYYTLSDIKKTISKRKKSK
jgi:uncharacterized protein YbaP (TraB family)